MNPLESSELTIASNGPTPTHPISASIYVYVQAKHTSTQAYINIDMCINKDINSYPR